MKRYIIVFLLLLIAGCGQDKPEVPEATEVLEAAETPEATEAPETTDTPIPHGASSKPKIGARPKMSESQVVEIGKRTALSKGFHLKDYLKPTATFDSEKKDWTVVLDHKPPAFPGSQSLVLVNDQNGKATLFSGE